MMRVMSSTPSPTVAAPDWAHTWHFYIIFWSFWEAHDFLKEAQSQRIKILYYFIVPWGTHRELVNTPWTHHVLHLFLVEQGTLLMGDLFYLFFGHFILFSGAFGRLTISSRHKVKELKYCINLLCHGTPIRSQLTLHGPTMCFIYLLLSGVPSLWVI